MIDAVDDLSAWASCIGTRVRPWLVAAVSCSVVGACRWSSEGSSAQPCSADKVMIAMEREREGSAIPHGFCQPRSRGAVTKTRADEPVHMGGAPSPAVRQMNVGSAIPAASAAALEIAKRAPCRRAEA